ncbi:MAG TPA: ATP-binding protein [Polyangiaceae bacterium]|nr:ATP-binding protein [Polyangiaceae bacterium]
MSPASSAFPVASRRAEESGPAVVGKHAGLEFLTEPEQPSHFVKFYEEEQTLLDAVAEFLASGLRAGDRMLVVATPEHRDAFARRLERKAAPAASPDQITWLDAQETLSKLMVGGAPDRARFRSMVWPWMAKAKEGFPRAHVRAYGEMVNLLWRTGRVEAAIQLEEMWTEALQDHVLSVFCAFPIESVGAERDSARFEGLCRVHTHVIPAARFPRRETLETEIARRAELEASLHAALPRRAQTEEDMRACLRAEHRAPTAAADAVAFEQLFVGTFGHDLRNPLNTIINTARIMTMRGEVLPEGRKHLERLVSSATRMHRMIEQILDLTRTRMAGGIPIERTWQDLDPLVAKVITAVRAANPGRVVTYQKGGDCCASVDPDRVEQVLATLLGNAISHGSPERPVQVSLSGSALSVQLSVHNEGRPIDPELLPNLFDPFARPKKTAGRPDGLGLGLYITQRIIEAHDGIVSASSTAETGTVFEATLPKRERGVPARG